MSEKFYAYFAQLNDSQITPLGGYQRNSLHYPLISYVNHITGLYLSQNYEVIPVFIERIYDYLEGFSQNYPLGKYHFVVLDYVQEMTTFLKAQENLANVLISYEQRIQRNFYNIKEI